MALRILNSQSRAKEAFHPLDPAGTCVRMYTCGPTVYDSLHIGHARAYVLPDVVRRYLEFKGYQVRHVTNFTDVDDKIVKRALQERRPWREITETYIAESHEVLHALNVKPADAYPRATDHIPEMIEIVQRLIAKKHAYVAENGDVYFDTASYARYGNLSKRKLDEEEAGLSGRLDEERIKVKRNKGDFLLWKLNRNDRDELAKGGRAVPRWPSPWGEGRPGWHLECSAMSRRYLGVPFDIHCGGRDLLFPHHEDEKAQTECAYCEELGGAESVRYWVHNEFVTPKAIDGTVAEKMSKSLGNVKWVREMIWPDGPYDPMALRMMLLSSHYRSPIVFEPAMLDEAAARLERLYNALETVGRVLRTDNTISWSKTTEEIVEASDAGTPTFQVPLTGEVLKARQAFEAAMDDDFNTAGALGALFELVGKLNQELAKFPNLKVPPGDAAAFHEAARTIQKLLGVLGIRAERAARVGASGGDSEALMNVLLNIRTQARASKQFGIADGIRDAIAALGYELEDLPGGRWSVKKKGPPKEACARTLKAFEADQAVRKCPACGKRVAAEQWKDTINTCPLCGEKAIPSEEVFVGGTNYRLVKEGGRILM